MKIKFQMILELINEAYTDKITLPGYKRTVKNCAGLGLTDQETTEILNLMEFAHKGVVRPYLLEKMQSQACKGGK